MAWSTQELSQQCAISSESTGTRNVVAHQHPHNRSHPSRVWNNEQFVAVRKVNFPVLSFEHHLGIIGNLFECGHPQSRITEGPMPTYEADRLFHHRTSNAIFPSDRLKNSIQSFLQQSIEIVGTCPPAVRLDLSLACLSL